MLRAERVEHRGNWPQEQARGVITLAYLERHRRRLRLIADTGEAFLLDLERATVLEDGDGLALSDGGWIAVKAAVEDLIEVTAPPELLLRLAWHLGNRHLPAQIEAERILLRDDHVIVDMVRGLGGTIRVIAAPFSPEGGAYEAPAHSHHGDEHHHDHDHHHHHHDHDH